MAENENMLFRVCLGVLVGSDTLLRASPSLIGCWGFSLAWAATVSTLY